MILNTRKQNGGFSWPVEISEWSPHLLRVTKRKSLICHVDDEDNDGHQTEQSYFLTANWGDPISHPREQLTNCFPLIVENLSPLGLEINCRFVVRWDYFGNSVRLVVLQMDFSSDCWLRLVNWGIFLGKYRSSMIISDKQRDPYQWALWNFFQILQYPENSYRQAKWCTKWTWLIWKCWNGSKTIMVHM